MHAHSITSPTFRALMHLRTAAAELQGAAYSPSGLHPVEATAIRRMGRRIQRDLPALARSGLPRDIVWAVADAARGTASLGQHGSRFGAYVWYASAMPEWANVYSVASDQLSAISTLRRR